MFAAVLKPGGDGGVVALAIAGCTVVAQHLGIASMKSVGRIETSGNTGSVLGSSPESCAVAFTRQRARPPLIGVPEEEEEHAPPPPPPVTLHSQHRYQHSARFSDHLIGD